MRLTALTSLPRRWPLLGLLLLLIAIAALALAGTGTAQAQTNSAPTVANPIPDQRAGVGTAFSYTFPADTFNDADGDTLTYTATKGDGSALPSWLTFTASTRTFSGTPQTANVGTLSILVTASDGTNSVSDTFGLAVRANAAPTVANPIPDRIARERRAFSYTFPANTFNDADTSDTLTYTAAQDDGSALPSWLTFTASTRTFSGTPQVGDAGTVSIKVTASDGIASVSDTFDIVVLPNSAPTVARPIPDQSSRTGRAFSFQFPADTFDDADRDTLTYAATRSNGSALPSWMTFDAGARTFSGTPQSRDIGTVSVKVTASDGVASVSDTFDIVLELFYSPLTHRVTCKANWGWVPAGYWHVSKLYAFGGGDRRIPCDMRKPGWAFDSRPGVELGKIRWVYDGTPGFWDQGNLPPPYDQAVESVTYTAPDDPDHRAVRGTHDQCYREERDGGRWHRSVSYGSDDAACRNAAWNAYYRSQGGNMVDPAGGTSDTFSTAKPPATPVFFSAAVDGTTLTVTFDQPLDASRVPAPDAIYVTVNDARRNVVSGGVAIDGNTVSLTLASAVSHGDRVTVRYTRPLPSASWRDVESFADQEVTNNTGGSSGNSGNAGAASVTGVSVVSDAGSDRTYGGGDTIEVQVTFDGPVDVTGTPRLKIKMDPDYGGKWAAYEEGSGTGSLTFTHTVVEPNISTQGIAVLADTLALNGGTITAGGADADLAHDGLAHDANHTVDWQVESDTESGPGGTTGPQVPPSVTAVSVTSDPGGDDTYGDGDTITVSVTFDAAVDVTGAPQLTIKMDPDYGEKQAAFAGGSGAATLTFTHTVAEPNLSTQGIAVLADTLALNGGTIVSTAGSVAADLAHTGLAHDAGHKVDWQQSPPPANTPATGAPTVTGTARVGETLTADTSGISDADGLTGATFAYRWLADDADLAGATGSAYTLADADVGKAVRVRVSFTDDAGHGETLTSAATAPVAARPPEVTAVAITSDPGDDDTYGDGDVITVSVTFDEAVDVTGAPRLRIKMDPDYGGKRVFYSGGSGSATLTFTHTVVEPNISTQGIAVLAGSLRRNGGTIQSAATGAGADLSHDGLAHDAGHKVDWKQSPPPANNPATGTPTVTGTAQVGETLTADISGISDADGLTGAAFAYQWLADDADLPGATGSAYTPASADVGKAVRVRVSFTDDAGHGETLTSAATAPVAAANPPEVTAVAITSDPGDDDTYGDGDVITISVTFDRAVNVTGAPRIAIDMDPADWGEKQAAYHSGGGTTTLTFTHTVAEPNLSTQGIAVLAGSLRLNGGTIQSASGSAAADLAHDGLAHDANHKVDWRPPAPAVTAVSITSDPGGDDTYGKDDVIRITVTFDQAVNVTGAPQLKIDMDPADWGEKQAAYHSGSGTTTLTFTHKVAEPNLSTQGIAVLADTLALNGGTIVSASGSVAADLAHAGLAHDANHKVDWRLSDDGGPGS